MSELPAEIGGGKYEDACTAARLSTQAEGVILIVMNGNKGQGFSCQLTIRLMDGIPDVLRSVADQIEAANKKRKNQ